MYFYDKDNVLFGKLMAVYEEAWLFQHIQDCLFFNHSILTSDNFDYVYYVN